MVRVEFTGSFGFRLSLLEKPSSGLLIAFLMDSHVVYLQDLHAMQSAAVETVLTVVVVSADIVAPPQLHVLNKMLETE